MKRISVLILFLLASFLQGQESRSEDDLLLGIDYAVSQSEYEKALELIDRGKALYPESNRFPARAGELYMEKKLFNLALEEFREAEALDPTPAIRYELSRLHGFMDNNEESASYLETLLDDPQYKEDALADLSWMYFKLHRLRDGEALLLGALEEGFNRTFAHTLGTVYSGLYEYEKSKRYYLESIDSALAGSDNYFSAVAYYNLALLEMTFYNYEQALEYTSLSLDQVNRPSGHVAMGELLQLSLDYEGARGEFLEAFSLNDESPLALLDLADLNREFGYLDKALEQIGDVRRISDNSWMYYYGMNRMEWDLDITEILMDCYGGKLREESVTLHRGVKERAASLFRRIRYGWLFRYHRGHFRKLCRTLGEIQLSENNPLHGWTLLAEGAGDYGKTALFYWKAARDFETALTERASSWYDLRIGKEAKDAGLLARGYGQLVVPWENSLRSEALAARIGLLGRKGRGTREYRELVNEMYGLNRGSLRQKGLTLPVLIDVAGDEEKTLARWLSRLHPGGDAENPSLCYHLVLTSREGGISSWQVIRPDGRILREGRRETPRLDREGRTMLIEAVEDHLYGGGE